MKDYVQTVSDNGGVHTNSGIPNKAFHDLAIELGGNSWEKAGRIWYETLRSPRVKPNATFTEFAACSVAKAGRLYGSDSAEAKAVKGSWHGVGIDVD